MAYDKQKVIDIALGEVGYLEKETASNLDSKTGNAGDQNYTKYARDLANVNFFNGRKQGAAWCAVFVAWCFYKAFGKAAALELLCQPTNASSNCGAGCRYARKYFKDKNQLHDTPQPGDMVFFYSKDKSQIAHTGLVYKVDGSKVYTVEGNTSGASGVIANGGGVCTKSYSLSYDRLAGFGRPNYGAQSAASDSKPAASAQTEEYTVRRGDSLWMIAKKQLGRGTRYKEIMALNGLTSDLIRAGQKLKLPKK